MDTVQQTTPEQTAKDFLRRGADAYRRKLWSEAAVICAQGLEKFPENAHLWHGLGRILRSGGENKDREALICFSRAHKLAPDNTMMRMDYANFLSKREHYAEAEHHYAGIYQKEGESGHILFALGDHYQRATRYGFASACFWRASELQPHFENSKRRYDELVGRYNAPFHPRFLDDVRARMAQAAAKPLAPYAP